MKLFFSRFYLVYVIMCFSGITLGCGAAYNAPFLVLFPEIPAAWDETLGSPRWRVEWINSEGGTGVVEVENGGACSIDVFQEWASPVIAYPYWDNAGKIYGAVPPTMMRPAGGIFPWDADLASRELSLSWTGGVSAEFYRELAQVEPDQIEPDAALKRRPQYFNWTRFRELLEYGDITEEARRDPWLADWRDIAQKTAASGFDRRRIKPAASETVTIPAPAPGMWLGCSPFAAPTAAREGMLSLRARIDGTVSVFVSKNGIIKINTETWMYQEFEKIHSAAD
jgi:hypothetical protein